MGLPSKRIAILFHESDRHRDMACYAVHHLAHFWREDGHNVEYLFGTGRNPSADILLVHVNLSLVPVEYLEFASAYPRSLNASIRDVRKSTFSCHLVHDSSDWDGPVIVKSDLNYGGEPEQIMQRNWAEHKWRWARRARRAMQSIHRNTAPLHASGQYEIYAHKDSVPIEKRDDSRLIVEKFLPELEDGLYHTRTYMFLGDRWTCNRLAARERIVKEGVSERIEEIDPHPMVARWRRDLKIEYGKFDYVINNGEAILLDVNKTVGASIPSHDEDNRADRRNRAEGLYGYF